MRSLALCAALAAVAGCSSGPEQPRAPEPAPAGFRVFTFRVLGIRGQPGVIGED